MDKTFDTNLTLSVKLLLSWWVYLTKSDFSNLDDSSVIPILPTKASKTKIDNLQNLTSAKLFPNS